MSKSAARGHLKGETSHCYCIFVEQLRKMLLQLARLLHLLLRLTPQSCNSHAAQRPHQGCALVLLLPLVIVATANFARARNKNITLYN